jgi:hypothetical protein
VTGVCGFPVMNLTQPTADGWSGTRDADVESVRGEVVSLRLPQYDDGEIGISPLH